MAYEKLGRYQEAEKALEKSLSIFRIFGETTGQNYARALNNLANVYLSQKRYTKATDMFERILATYRNSLPDQTRDIALVVNNLGLAHLSQGHYPAAEQLFRESLDLHRQARSSSHNLAATLNNLAFACKLQNRLQEAAELYSQAIDVWRSEGALTRPEIAIGLHNLASLENVLGDNTKSEEHFKEALAIFEASLPPEHPTRTAAMTGYADLLVKLKRKREAKQLLAGVKTLRAMHDHENLQDQTVDVRNLFH
jgi:tetratricopeptide (TPR) repeat protein